MARSSRHEQQHEYFIFKYDKMVCLHSLSQSILSGRTPVEQQLKILKGTLLQLSPVKPRYTIEGSPRISVRSLDVENVEFDCFYADVSPLSFIEKNLLIAVTVRSDRYEIFANHKQLMLGLTVKPGDWVYVTFKVDGALRNVAGVLRYRGELPGEQGIQFGVELEEYRGSGTTDGTFRKQQFFSCEQDCGLFVSISRLSKRYNVCDKEKRYYDNKPRMMELDAVLNPSVVCVGDRVRLFTEKGEKTGEVLYFGIPPGETREFVGIHMDFPVAVGERNNGKFNDHIIFYPRDLSRTILVPKVSTYPEGSLVQQSEPEAALSMNPFDFNIGSRVSIDTQQEGLKEGVVIWIGRPEHGAEKLVGIELDQLCCEFNDGFYNGKRLFVPEHPERTILVPGMSVWLSALDTVKDSLGSETSNHETHFADVTRLPDHARQPPSPRTTASPTDLSTKFDDFGMKGSSDVIPSSSSRKHQSAPVADALMVYGKGIREEKPASTGSVPMHQNYGQKTERVSSREAERPKTTRSKYAARTHSDGLAARQSAAHWTTNKFPSSTEGRSTRRTTGETSSAKETTTFDRKTEKFKGQRSRTTTPIHGRVVSKFTLPDDVLTAVAMHVYSSWKQLAEHLCIVNREIVEISDLNGTAKDCALDMLRRWREQMSSSRDKLGPLVKACRKAKLNFIANQLEQGLDEQMLHHVAGQVHESVWNVLGQSLGLDRDHIAQLQMEDPHPSQRVYNMLLDWRLLQGFDTNKQLTLAHALNNIGMEELALEVCRGLTADLLDHLGYAVRDFWKRLGRELKLRERELHDLEGTDPQATGYRVINKWRLRQDQESDLLGPLAEALSNCDRGNLADLVVKGISDSLLDFIANVIEPKRNSIARELRIPLQGPYGHNDSHHGDKPNTLRLLKWWRANRAPNEAQGRMMLHDALVKYNFQDAAKMVLPERADVLRGSADIVHREQQVHIPAPKDLDDAHLLAEVSKMQCSSMQLADKLNLSQPDVDRIKKQWHDMAKQKFFLLRSWINGNKSVYHGNNLGWQLCKILLEMDMNQQAELLVPGVSSYRDWFLQTDFESFEMPDDNVVGPPAYPQTYPRLVPPAQPYGYSKDIIEVDRSPEAQGLELGVESVVEVKIRDESHYGVIRSLTQTPGWPDDDMAGIELEDPVTGGTNGSFEDNQYFECGLRKAVFVYLSQCRPDSRFPTGADTYRVFTRETSLDYGNQESPIIQGYVEPKGFTQESIGENRGIQGDQNSCYLDVTLYSMFSFNVTFDPLLRRPREARDKEEFERIQEILREKIVNPLRQHGFVRADRVRDLRVQLDKLGFLPGMTNEEKDPEELLHMLLRDVFKSQPLIETRHSDTKETDSQYLYQIFMDKNDSLQLPRVEQLLHQSFLDNELKLVDIPECLLVQMPRFGKAYKMYRRILPSLTIDITDLLENYPRQCTVCGDLAVLECRDCRPDQEISEEFIKSYCPDCYRITHDEMKDHRIKELTLPPDVRAGFEVMKKTKGQFSFQRQRMELFAVVCIQTSHYVAFVKTEAQPNQWVFFDSMADRDASSIPGFNIPKVTHLKDFEVWLSNPEKINMSPDDKQLPEHLRRLLGDSYICFYRRIDPKPTSRGQVREPASGATNY